jgi:hypothetical protein
MNLIARLTALERRQLPPTPRLTDAQWLKLADKLIADYCTKGREGFIAHWGWGLGAAFITGVADRLEAMAERARQRLEQR